MLIVDGPDNVGKTTLCRRLVAELGARHGGWMYRHFGPLPKTWEHPWDYERHVGTHVVMDRFHPSEVVYRAALGEDLNLSPLGYSIVDSWVRLAGGMVVLLYSSNHDVFKRGYEDRPQGNDVKVNAVASLFFENMAGYRNFKTEQNDTYDVAVDAWYDVAVEGCYPAENDAFVRRLLEAYLSKERRVLRVRSSWTG